MNLIWLSICQQQFLIVIIWNKQLVYCYCFSILGAYVAGLPGEDIHNIQNNSPAVKQCLGHVVAHLVDALCYKPEGSSPIGVNWIFH